MAFSTASSLHNHFRAIFGRGTAYICIHVFYLYIFSCSYVLDEEGAIDNEEDGILDERNQPVVEQAGAGEENSSVQSERSENMPDEAYSRDERGTIIVNNSDYLIRVKATSHARQTRYSLDDHLYNIWVEQKDRGPAPYLADLEEGLERALITVLNNLKDSYPMQRNYQIYVTIVDDSITSGLNSGNYSLRTPSHKIARWMMAMLYHYLKSNQTMRLNRSFKIQVKVLSVTHTQDLVNSRRGFRQHFHH